MWNSTQFCVWYIQHNDIACASDSAILEFHKCSLVFLCVDDTDVHQRPSQML